ERDWFCCSRKRRALECCAKHPTMKHRGGSHCSECCRLVVPSCVPLTNEHKSHGCSSKNVGHPVGHILEPDIRHVGAVGDHEGRRESAQRCDKEPSVAPREKEQRSEDVQG